MTIKGEFSAPYVRVGLYNKSTIRIFSPIKGRGRSRWLPRARRLSTI